MLLPNPHRLRFGLGKVILQIAVGSPSMQKLRTVIHILVNYFAESRSRLRISSVKAADLHIPLSHWKHALNNPSTFAGNFALSSHNEDMAEASKRTGPASYSLDNLPTSWSR
jgi:hypothetical protein